MYSFDVYSGFLFPPYLTFPQAPLRSRTVGFPESGSDRGFYSYGLPLGGEAKMLAHIHPNLQRFTDKTRPIFNGVVAPGPVSKTIQGPPRAQSPFARLRRYLFRRDVFCIASEGVTPPSSLLRTHAPNHIPPVVFGSPYSTGLCRLSPDPAGIWSFPTLSLQSLHGCLDPYPGMPLWCSHPFLPRKLQPQPRCTYFGASNLPPQCKFNGDPVSRRQSFRYVQAPMVASPPDCTYRTGSMSCGQPGRLRHAMDWKLPSRTVVSLHDRNGQLS
jgi:hypothetical protein